MSFSSRTFFGIFERETKRKKHELKRRAQNLVTNAEIIALALFLTGNILLRLKKWQQL